MLADSGALAVPVNNWPGVQADGPGLADTQFH